VARSLRGESRRCARSGVLRWRGEKRRRMADGCLGGTGRAAWIRGRGVLDGESARARAGPAPMGGTSTSRSNGYRSFGTLVPLRCLVLLETNEANSHPRQRTHKTHTSPTYTRRALASSSVCVSNQYGLAMRYICHQAARQNLVPIVPCCPSGELGDGSLINCRTHGDVKEAIIPSTTASTCPRARRVQQRS
jgi:hypothetical protein